jgi:DhnA family fructose-bisphosphate aldolase class Ia
LGFLGKLIRLNRLFREDGRCVLITFDHAIAHGVLGGLEPAQGKLRALAAGGPDGIVVQKGIASRFWPVELTSGTSLVLKATSYAPSHRTFDSPTATVDEALRLGADAISVGVIVGGPRQPEQTEFLARIVRDAESAGLPVGAHLYPRGEGIATPGVSDFMYAVRVGSELGIDFVKTNWTGDEAGFARVVEAAGIPVLVAGGAPDELGFDGLLETTRRALAAGGRGVAYGRAIWQAEDPEPNLRRLLEVVHPHAGDEPGPGLPVRR